jgi:hypothetical protein
VTVLAVVESHRSSSCAIARFIPAAAYWQSVGAGGGLNKNQALAAVGARRHHEAPRLKRDVGPTKAIQLKE